MTASPPTKKVRCAHWITGPRVGRSTVVAWRKRCKVVFSVPAGWPNTGQKCRHHRSSAESDRLRVALAGE